MSAALSAEERLGVVEHRLDDLESGRAATEQRVARLERWLTPLELRAAPPAATPRPAAWPAPVPGAAPPSSAPPNAPAPATPVGLLEERILPGTPAAASTETAQGVGAAGQGSGAAHAGQPALQPGGGRDPLQPAMAARSAD